MSQYLDTHVDGGIGGILIYNNLSEGQKAFGFELLMPTIIATVVMMVILSILKKKLFANKEEFEKAVQLIKDQNDKG